MHSSQDGFLHPTAIIQVIVGDALQVTIAFINAVSFQKRGKFRQDRNKTVTEIAVQSKITRKHGDIVLFNQVPDLKKRRPHPDELFGFRRTGNHTAVIVHRYTFYTLKCYEKPF